MKEPMIFAAVASAMALGPVPMVQAAPAHAASPARGLPTCEERANAALPAVQGPPRSAEAVIQMQHALFLLDRVIEYMNENCPGDARIAEFQASYQSAKDVCLQVASSASYCVPRQYVR